MLKKKYILPKGDGFPIQNNVALLPSLIYSFCLIRYLAHTLAQVLSYALEMVKTKHTRTLVLNFSSFVYIILQVLLPLLSFRAKMKEKLFLRHQPAKRVARSSCFKVRSVRVCASVCARACMRALAHVHNEGACGPKLSGASARPCMLAWRGGSTLWQDASILFDAVLVLKFL